MSQAEWWKDRLRAPATNCFLSGGARGSCHDRAFMHFSFTWKRQPKNPYSAQGSQRLVVVGEGFVMFVPVHMCSDRNWHSLSQEIKLLCVDFNRTIHPPVCFPHTWQKSASAYLILLKSLHFDGIVVKLISDRKQEGRHSWIRDWIAP